MGPISGIVSNLHQIAENKVQALKTLEAMKKISQEIAPKMLEYMRASVKGSSGRWHSKVLDFDSHTVRGLVSCEGRSFDVTLNAGENVLFLDRFRCSCRYHISLDHGCMHALRLLFDLPSLMGKNFSSAFR